MVRNPSLLDRISGATFQFVHGNNLVYNQCWEDPRLDHVALGLRPSDVVLVITSAGCNALDYAIEAPKAVHAVDINPRQNALLEFKQAGIRSLEYDDFFAFFGEGRHPRYREIYRDAIRPQLTPRSSAWWDGHQHYFSGKGQRPSFYFHGTAGAFARLMNFYIDRVAKVRPAIEELLAASTTDEQKAIYDAKLRGPFWTRFIKWLVGMDSTLALLGVPRPQRQQVERHYPGGIAQFIEERVEEVFTRLPIADNYFWRVYLTGRFTRDCCPRYLTREGFQKLKAGLVDRVHTHTMSVQQYAETAPEPISRFILLDHMDWLSSVRYPLLESEWQAIVEKASPDARVLWRSGGLKVDFVDPVRVTINGRQRRVGDLLTYHPDLAAELHTKDRVNTYGSFYIADLRTA